MGIVYKLDAKGGFTAGDTVSKRTAYAYPSSPNAKAAKKNPLLVATQMMSVQNELVDRRDKVQDALRLAALTATEQSGDSACRC